MKAKSKIERFLSKLGFSKCSECGGYYYNWDDHFDDSRRHHKWLRENHPTAYRALKNDGNFRND